MFKSTIKLKCSSLIYILKTFNLARESYSLIFSLNKTNDSFYLSKIEEITNLYPKKEKRKHIFGKYFSCC